MVGILHRGMTKRLDMIEVDIKPIVGQVLLHSEQIKEIREDHLELKLEVQEQTKWINGYDSRLQAAERTLSVLTK